MASNRSYRNALPQEVIRSELLAGKGTQFDPEIVEVMLTMVDEDREYQMRQLDDQQKTILVVAEEVTNIELLKEIFQAQPVYRLLTAVGGQEALKLLQQGGVDLVLLDMELSDTSGLEVFKRMKGICDIPVVFMTAAKDLSAMERARELGADDYVTKPIMPQILLETVYGALNWEN